MFFRGREIAVGGGALGLGMEALEARALLAAPTAAVVGMWTDATSLTAVIEWSNAFEPSLGNGDLTTEANGRHPITGVMVGSPVQTGAARYRVAYKFNAYDNAWGSTDIGTYTFKSPAGQVTSPNGEVIANPVVHTRSLWFSEPKSRLISQTMNTTNWLIVIQYDSLNGIQQNTIDASDLTLATGATAGISVHSVIQNSSTRTTVVYRIDAPEGAWSWANNGVHRVTIGTDKVRDNSNRAVSAHTYQDFHLWFATPRAQVLPTTVNENDWIIPIKYTAKPGSVMNPATLVTVGVVHVAGPGGFLMDGEFAGIQNHQNGSYTISYRIYANGGSWDFRDNGSYNLVIKPNRASDDSGRFVPTYTMKTYGLWFTTPAAEVVTPTTPSSTVWNLNIRFRDDVQIDRSTINVNSIRILDPMGLELTASLISISPFGTSNTYTAQYRILAPSGFESGEYKVFLNRDGVRDSGGRIAAENLIGTFTFNF